MSGALQWEFSELHFKRHVWGLSLLCPNVETLLMFLTSEILWCFSASKQLGGKFKLQNWHSCAALLCGRVQQDRRALLLVVSHSLFLYTTASPLLLSCSPIRQTRHADRMRTLCNQKKILTCPVCTVFCIVVQCTVGQVRTLVQKIKLFKKGLKPAHNWGLDLSNQNLESPKLKR